VKKIIALDDWTQGSHHFARLVQPLRAHGYSLILVHLGSWGNDPGRPDREQIGDLEVRDIRCYGSLERLLDTEQPAAVILASTFTFLRRAFLRYCAQRSIPSLLLYHGLVSVQAEEGSKPVEGKAWARFVASKIPRLITKVLPIYIKSLVTTGASAADWRRFVNDSFRMAAGRINPMAANDARTTGCTVYADPDKDHAMRTFGFRSSEVAVVGNPDLMRFGLTEELIAEKGIRRRPASEYKYVMYINSALMAVGRVFSGPQGEVAFERFITELASALRAQGYSLMFKPHPLVRREVLDRLTSKTNVTLVSNDMLAEQLTKCAACVVEATTLAMIPALMGVPLLLANCPPLEDLRFGAVLTSYPRSHVLRDVNDISRILRDEDANHDRTALDGWITRNAGPLPATLMPSRVAEFVVGLRVPGRTTSSGPATAAV
jgi:hypothetical protein